jgi:hypothetical protein
MASAELSRRVRKVVGYPPLCDMTEHQRREFHEASLDADSFDDLPGRWQAAILKAEQSGRSCGWSGVTSHGTPPPAGPGSRPRPAEHRSSGQ